MHHDIPLSGLRVTPPLDPADADYLVAAAAVVDWPGRPVTRCPWAPCQDGCCLALLADRGRVLAPGAAAQWLRFLVRTYLHPHHTVDGEVPLLSAHGLVRSVLLVDGGDVFEGVLDDPVDREAG